MSAVYIQRNSHAPVSGIAPVKFAVLRIELELLGSMRASLGNDGRQGFPIEIRAIDRAVIRADATTHICPVDMAGLRIDDDAVREFPGLRDCLQVQPVGIARRHPTASEI